MSENCSSEKFKYTFDEVDRPLELIVDLIRKQEINIYDIPIAQITEQFLQYIENAEKTGLDDLTEFYLMAATLIYIKSKMLLPGDVDLSEEFEDPRQELVEKLIEYQKYKKLTELMSEKILEADWYIEKRKKQKNLPFPESEDMWDQMDIWALCKTFSGLLKNVPFDVHIFEEITIDQKTTLIDEFLIMRQEFLFSDLILKQSVMEIICSFLAILNYVKEKKISIFQNRMFGEIKITKYIKKDEVD